MTFDDVTKNGSLTDVFQWLIIMMIIKCQISLVCKPTGRLDGGNSSREAA